MDLFELVLGILEVPNFGVVSVIGLAFILGVLLGWVWKPSYVSLEDCKIEVSPLGFIPSPVKSLGSIQNLDSSKYRAPNLGTFVLDDGLRKEKIAQPALNSFVCSSSIPREEESVVVTNQDLEHLCLLVERKDAGPQWKHMMDRSAHNMSYQAWQRDPKTGPPQYCSRTVYEDASPELMRDFFWDDEFRLKWDDMLLHATVIEESPTTGTMVVHWIRKFPFFCSNREYIIGRRMWESETSYYAVTKGVPCLSVPRKDKPRRVDLFYSSWHIKAVESEKGNGQMSACEVILFHHEDMGIPWEIARYGVKQGMWGAVRNIEKGFRAYQLHRASGASLSHHAIVAQLTTKFKRDHLKKVSEQVDQESSEPSQLITSPHVEIEKPNGVNIPKLLIVGGVVAVVCSLDRGLLTKTLIFGVAKRFGNMGKRAFPRTP